MIGQFKECDDNSSLIMCSDSIKHIQQKKSSELFQDKNNQKRIKNWNLQNIFK